MHDGLVFTQSSFHNTGLYNIDFEGGYPDVDRGLIEMTGEPEDMGAVQGADSSKHRRHRAVFS